MRPSSSTPERVLFAFPAAGGRDAELVAFAHSVGDMLASLTRPRGVEESEVGFARSGAAPLRGRLVQALGPRVWASSHARDVGQSA